MARRRRRRRWLLLLLLLALIAFILGNGLGLFPSPGASEGSRPEPPPLPADSPGAADQAKGPAGDGDGAQQDRLHSLRSTLVAASRSGRLGAGYAAVSALRAAALPEPELAAAREELDAALQQALARLQEELAQGRVLVAHKRLLALLQDGAAEVRSAVDRFGSSKGFAPFTAQLPAAVPAPEPLPRDLLVRADLHGREVAGRVVDARSNEVTLRVASEAGVTFPTLAATAMEPVQPNAVLAAELGFAALRAGEGLLGRCWLACGLSCGSAPPVRLQELRALLQ